MQAEQKVINILYGIATTLEQANMYLEAADAYSMLNDFIEDDEIAEKIQELKAYNRMAA